jgi:hypothetical protein
MTASRLFMCHLLKGIFRGIGRCEDTALGPKIDIIAAKAHRSRARLPEVSAACSMDCFDPRQLTQELFGSAVAGCHSLGKAR